MTEETRKYAYSDHVAVVAWPPDASFRSMKRHEVVMTLPDRRAVEQVIHKALDEELRENYTPDYILLGGELYFSLSQGSRGWRDDGRFRFMDVPVLLDRRLGEREVRIMCTPEHEQHKYLKGRGQ